MSAEEFLPSRSLKTTENFPGGAPHDERILVREVANVVRWVNPNLLLPFDLEVGNASPLGLVFDDRKTTGISLAVRWFHGRSGDLGRIFIRDASGSNVYRDIDLKGCGFVDSSLGERGKKLRAWQWAPYMQGQGGYYGLLHKSSAEKDSEITEKFARYGIRCHRSVAIISLKALPTENEAGETVILRVEELRDLGRLSRDFDPVIQVRAYVTKTRLHDVLESDDSEHIRAEFADAFSLCAGELGVDNVGAKQYFEWFARSLFLSIGRMHSHGYVHNNLGRTNITLDARIVDLDTVEDASVIGAKEWEDRRKRDYQDVCRSVDSLALLLRKSGYEMSGDIPYDQFEALYRSEYRN